MSGTMLAGLSLPLEDYKREMFQFFDAAPWLVIRVRSGVVAGECGGDRWPDCHILSHVNVGDTPANSDIAAIALQWIDQWIAVYYEGPKATPLEHDEAACAVAEHLGAFDVQRRGRIIDITDRKALPAEFVKMAPDYAAIRKALEAGYFVPGATLTNRQEYTLREIK